MTKTIPSWRIDAELGVRRAGLEHDADAAHDGLAALGFFDLSDSRFDRKRVLDHVRALNAWYATDEPVTLTPEYVSALLVDAGDPRSDYWDLMKDETLPPDSLFASRMQGMTLAYARPSSGPPRIGTASCRNGSTARSRCHPLASPRPTSLDYGVHRRRRRHELGPPPPRMSPRRLGRCDLRHGSLVGSRRLLFAVEGRDIHAEGELLVRAIRARPVLHMTRRPRRRPRASSRSRLSARRRTAGAFRPQTPNFGRGCPAC